MEAIRFTASSLPLLALRVQFAATQHYGRFQGEADMNRQSKPAESVEDDPKQT
jgi:hypothetical protein